MVVVILVALKGGKLFMALSVWVVGMDELEKVNLSSLFIFFPIFLGLSVG